MPSQLSDRVPCSSTSGRRSTAGSKVLEWQLDPTSDARIPQAAYDTWVVLFCNEGYASSLAATSLQDLGIEAATDMIGGYRAWRAAGLPTTDGIPG